MISYYLIYGHHSAGGLLSCKLGLHFLVRSSTVQNDKISILMSGPFVFVSCLACVRLLLVYTGKCTFSKS